MHQVHDILYAKKALNKKYNLHNASIRLANYTEVSLFLHFRLLRKNIKLWLIK